MNRRTFLQGLPALALALQAPFALADDLAVAHLRIDGMTWGGWPPLVKRALEGLKGVRKAEVSFERREAIVTYEKGMVTIDQMGGAVAQYGFKATLQPSHTPEGR